MSEVTLSCKYALTAEQIQKLMDEGKPTKCTWYCQVLNTKQFVNYTGMLGVERVKGNVPFNLTFPDGVFKPNDEIKVAVGDWNVMDDNGRHCLQSNFFYISPNGKVMPCKFKELPSQGGVPPLPEDDPLSLDQQSASTVESTSTETVPTTPTAPQTVVTDNDIVLIKGKVYCYKCLDAMNVDDFCSDWSDNGQNNDGDQVCKNCAFAKALFYKQ